MDLRTGKIHNVEEGGIKKLIKKIGHSDVVPLTKREATVLLPLSKRRRKALMSGGACPCASGKSFKKCHGRKGSK